MLLRRSTTVPPPELSHLDDQELTRDDQNRWSPACRHQGRHVDSQRLLPDCSDFGPGWRGSSSPSVAGIIRTSEVAHPCSGPAASCSWEEQPAVVLDLLPAVSDSWMEISPGPLGAERPSSRGMVTDGGSFPAPTRTTMRDVAVRQSRFSPARDLELPAPRDFTVTDQTLRGKSRRVQAAVEESGRRQSAVAVVLLLLGPLPVLLVPLLLLHQPPHGHVPVLLLLLVLHHQHQGVILGVQRQRVAFPGAVDAAHTEAAPQVPPSHQVALGAPGAHQGPGNQRNQGGGRASVAEEFLVERRRRRLHAMALLALLLWRALGLLGAAVGALAAAWTVRLLLRHAWFTHRLSCFSTPPTHSWLLGHMGQMQSTEEGLRQVDELVQTYKHSCSWFLGPFYHLVRVFHPDYAKPLLMAPASITVKDELIYGHLRPWLGRSLLTSSGDEWSRKRRLLTPAFHFDILKSYVSTFNSSAKTMHEKWRRLVAAGQTNLDMFSQVNLMTLDTLLKCAFSHHSNCQESSSEYVSAIEELSDLIIDRRLRILHHWDWIYYKTQQGKRFRRALSVVHRFTRDVIQKRRALIKQQTEGQPRDGTAPQKKKDFVDIVLMSKDEEGKGLSDQEIEAEANTFMFAGHDSTASAICWTLYNLARHADYQDRCRQEVKDLLQGRDGDDIQWEDLSNLPFTTMCIRESLRLHCPVQAVTRRYSKDITLPGGRTVPQGVICLVSIYGTHHNPTVWADPHEFDPLRFDAANLQNKSSHAFIPFSSGPRNCIGQKFALAELRVVVASTLLRFQLTPGRDPGRGGGDPGVVRRLPQLVMRAEGGLWLQLEALEQ